MLNQSYSITSRNSPLIYCIFSAGLRSPTSLTSPGVATSRAMCRGGFISLVSERCLELREGLPSTRIWTHWKKWCFLVSVPTLSHAQRKLFFYARQLPYTHSKHREEVVRGAAWHWSSPVAIQRMWHETHRTHVGHDIKHLGTRNGNKGRSTLASCPKGVDKASGKPTIHL